VSLSAGMYYKSASDTVDYAVDDIRLILR
jgi:hypothetical protein